MRRQILLDAPPGKIKERTSECEVPNEYECCYCDSKVFQRTQVQDGISKLVAQLIILRFSAFFFLQKH